MPRPNLSSVFHLLNSSLYCITLCRKEEDQETALRDERQQGDHWYGVRTLTIQTRRRHAPAWALPTSSRRCKQLNLKNIQQSQLAKLRVSTSTLTSIYTVRQTEYALNRRYRRLLPWLLHPPPHRAQTSDSTLPSPLPRLWFHLFIRPRDLSCRIATTITACPCRHCQMSNGTYFSGLPTSSLECIC